MGKQKNALSPQEQQEKARPPERFPQTHAHEKGSPNDQPQAPRGTEGADRVSVRDQPNVAAPEVNVGFCCGSKSASNRYPGRAVHWRVRLAPKRSPQR